MTAKRILTVPLMLDRATGWIAVCPNVSKTAEHTVEAFKHVAGPTDKIASFYSDNAPELAAAARECTWRAATATTGQPQTNGVATRHVRTLKEGGGCGIVQSRFKPKWWNGVGEHSCFSKNIAMEDGDSSYNRRHGKGHFKGESIPFGASVDFMPQSEKTSCAYRRFISCLLFIYFIKIEIV